MASKGKILKKISSSEVKTFKIRNRKGIAAICMNNLTEGATLNLAMTRMDKALKRMGYTIHK